MRLAGSISNMNRQPLVLMGLGLLLMVVGVVMPFLMVIHLVESTFFLIFASFIASTVGMFLGMIGAAGYVHNYRNQNRR